MYLSFGNGSLLIYVRFPITLEIANEISHPYGRIFHSLLFHIL